MDIQIDSREKARAINKIIKSFSDAGVRYYISKLFVGDYMSLDNPRVIIDRKQNLSELCKNTKSKDDHERFRSELVRARERGIQIIILCEHGGGIDKLSDVIWWVNPLGKKRVHDENGWHDVKTKATTGEELYKTLYTMQEKYGVRFEFCSKQQTGARIIELLGGTVVDKGRN